MIDPLNPDYTNTPISPQRPIQHYQPAAPPDPFLSIITPYYNTGAVFAETVENIRRMPFTNWEWIIVSDGSTNPNSLAQLIALEAEEPRVRILHQRNRGPAAARNRAALAARGKYLLFLDADDLIEPTFAEKALWFLETHPEFAFCNAYNVGFGAETYLWEEGFGRKKDFLKDNWVIVCAVIRRDAHLKAGGFDESVRHGHEDWDYWLNLAQVGEWGYTIPEHLTWYRRRDDGRLATFLNPNVSHHETPRQQFIQWLQKKHHRLYKNFPKIAEPNYLHFPFTEVDLQRRIPNRNQKIAGKRHVLVILPWLRIGGADKFNVDMIEHLSQKDVTFTIVTTTDSRFNTWIDLFARHTVDIFGLDLFLAPKDYAAFVSYLIDSRGIDTVLVSNAEAAYHLLPHWSLQHPAVTFLDYIHMEEPYWKNGGYPAMSVRVQDFLDQTVVSTQHLKQWMVERGANGDRIQVCTTNIDPDVWNPAAYDTAAWRAEAHIPDDTAVILFVGRVVDQKRPLLFADIIRQVAKQHPNLLAVIIGEGDRLAEMKAFARKHHLREKFRFVGAQPLDVVKQWMAAGDVLLLPSQGEGLALVLYEALAMEVVPVAADVGGQRELVTPDCGFIIPHADDERDSYVRALLDVLANPQKRQQMGNAGRQHIIAQFTLDKMAQAMDAHLRADYPDSPRKRPLAERVAALQTYYGFVYAELTRLQKLAEVLWLEAQTASVDIIPPIDVERRTWVDRLRWAYRGSVPDPVRLKLRDWRVAALRRVRR